MSSNNTSDILVALAENEINIIIDLINDNINNTVVKIKEHERLSTILMLVKDTHTKFTIEDKLMCAIDINKLKFSPPTSSKREVNTE